ncbi:MAG: LCP family protein, partial [Oscillospiraceae bacterium]
PFTIEYLPGKVIYQGEQTLNGEHAEWLVRYRKGYATGDIGRVNVQTEFLKALITSVKQKGRINAVNLLAKNYSEITTDLPLNKMIEYANEAYKINPQDISYFVAEGSGAMNKSYAVYQLDAAKLAECLNTNFRPLGEFVSEQELEIQQVPLPPPVQEKEYTAEDIAEENFFAEYEYTEPNRSDTETEEQESLWFDELFS